MARYRSRRDPDGREAAEKYARMVRKWSPAGRRMRGAELEHWREESLRGVLERNHLSGYFGEVKHLVRADATAAARKSNAARYRRAYGSSR